MAEAVEDDHRVAVDVVVVGDREIDDGAEALLGAAREALLNAAKHAAEPGPIRVYAEVQAERTELFVRDRGPGFDPAGVPADRRGVRESIVGRMRRAGGRAEVRSTAGEGTEVSLRDAAPPGRAGGRAPMSGAKPSVVIVDDHQLFRAGVRAELEGLAEVRAEAGTVEEGVVTTLREEPDVVLLDVHMPGGGAVEVIRQVVRERPAQRFLALSVSDAAEDVIAVIRAGARGYVTKSISAEQLAEAIARVSEGDAVFSPRLAGFALDAFQGEIPESEIDPELDQLTMRERQVLRLIARGYLYKEIALELGISPKTVEAHVSSVLRKLQLSNRHELSRWAAERRLLD